MNGHAAHERKGNEPDLTRMTPNGYGNSFEHEKVEPIAIIGFSLKFPQDATSPASFWKMLIEGRCAMGEVPEDRWNLASFYHPDSERKDAVCLIFASFTFQLLLLIVEQIPLRGGHFIDDDLSAFDAPFFSISSAEAAALDPQQRLLLETSYRALENGKSPFYPTLDISMFQCLVTQNPAGLPLDKILGSHTSVFTGSFTNDYLHLNTKDTERGSPYDVVGLSSFAMLANRLSWFYNFSGPSVNLDSACSSSLMALDMACRNLLDGDADMVNTPLWILLLTGLTK